MEGVLDVIQVGGRYEFRLREHGTKRQIYCRYDRAMLDQVKAALEKRVIVEGVVRYSVDGAPIRVSEIRSIWIVPEPQRTLDELRGALPTLTRGLSADEYVRQMREDGD